MQLYQCTLLAFLFSQLFVLTTKSQKVFVADVVIIGSVHSPSSNYNSDSLMKAVMNLKPDVILIEQDSTSYTFKTGAFKPLPGWSMYLRRIGVLSELDVEANMLQRYHREFPQVIIKPYDVAFNGAERERDRKDFLILQDDFADAMSEAYDRKEMSDYRESVHLAVRQFLSFLSQRIEGTMQELNADSTTEMIRQGETLKRMHFKALVDSVPSLQRFSNRVYKQLQLAEYRNEVMVQQILRYINEYSGKRIVVLTGALHRYYQLDKLAPKREQFNFRLLDINGEVMTFPSQPSTMEKDEDAQNISILQAGRQNISSAFVILTQLQ